jgi:hypothetical protein
MQAETFCSWQIPLAGFILAKVGVPFLTGLSLFLTYCLQAVFRFIDWLRDSLPYSAIVVALALIALSLSGWNWRRRRLGRAALLTSAAIIMSVVFFALAKSSVGGLCGQNPPPLFTAAMESVVSAGVGLYAALTGQVILARRVLLLAGVLACLGLAIRKTKRPRPYFRALALVAAGMAESFIITKNIPAAVYLFGVTVLLLLASACWRPTGAPDRGSWPPFVHYVSIIAVLLAAFCLGLYRLEVYPVRYHPDEAVAGNEIMARLVKLPEFTSSRENRLASIREHPASYFLWSVGQDRLPAGSWNPFFAYPAMLCLKLLPVDFVSVRTACVLAGMVSVLVLTLLGRRMFDPATGLLAGLFLAACSWQLALIRVTLNESGTTLYSLLVMYFLWTAVKSGNPILYALLGFMLSLSTKVYPSAKIMVYVSLVFLVWSLLGPRRRQSLRGLAITVAALLTIIYARGEALAEYFGYPHRDSAILVTSDVRNTYPVTRGEELALLLRYTLFSGRCFLQSLFRGDPFCFPRESYLERGMQFNPMLLGPMVMGFVLCLFRLRRKSHFLLALWFLASVAPDILTGYGKTDRRATLVVPPLMLMAALALSDSWRSIVWSILPPGRIYRTITVGVVMVLTAVILSTGAAEYFHTYRIHQTKGSNLQMAEDLKRFDLFLQDLSGPWPLYFFSPDGGLPTPHHEANRYAEFRSYSQDHGVFIRRQQAVISDAAGAVARMLLAPPPGTAGAAVINLLPRYQALISGLQRVYPPSAFRSYSCSGDIPFSVIALVLPGPAPAPRQVRRHE